MAISSIADYRHRHQLTQRNANILRQDALQHALEDFMPGQYIGVRYWAAFGSPRLLDDLEALCSHLEGQQNV